MHISAFPDESKQPVTPVPRLRLVGITKHYADVLANDRVSLTLLPGEIHAVLGENGAGKSTLMKIIYGAVRPDAGDIFFDGQLVRIKNPQQARALGISMVFQHFSLFDTLTVAENVSMGLSAQLSRKQVAQQIIEKAAEYGLEIDPNRPVYSLSVGEMQRVEIIRALLTHPKLLILDEPTSVLTPVAVEKLFIVLKKLASEGCSILYISHKLDEIRTLCNTCTVLRAGKVTGVCNPAEQSNIELSRLMIDVEPPALERRQVKTGREVLAVKQLSLPRMTQFGVALDQINLSVCAGEVVGIAGVSGNGQQELLSVLSGEDRRADAFMVQFLGQNVGRFSPSQRRKMGLHFVPEERLGRGTVPTLSLAKNLLLTRSEAIGKMGWICMATLREQTQSIIARFNVKAGGAEVVAQSLSGGNLQKFIMGREMDARPKLLIVAQPTWGVDVGAVAQIRAAILALRDEGCAVLVVSEELDELFELSDRMHVIDCGRLSPSIERQEATPAQMGVWMSGLWPQSYANKNEKVVQHAEYLSTVASHTSTVEANQELKHV